MGDSLSQAISFEYLLTEVIDIAESERGQRHIWQWLTKRPHRMAEFSTWLMGQGRQWPVNLWVGTSITTAATPARVAKLLRVGDETTTRFLSVEPQVEEVKLGEHLSQLDWIIQGGESGKDARLFDVGWARKLLAQCRDAAVPYFLKQLGAVVVEDGHPITVRDAHGGDWTEWPEDVRVREIPNGKGARRLLAQALADLEGEENDSEEAPPHEPAIPDTDTGDDDADAEGVEVDPRDGRAAESELNGLIAHLADDMSALATIKLLPRAKELYERLHPETRHGGSRGQVARSATWPSFAGYVAAHTGISSRTVYTRLETAEKLATLDPTAEVACFGTGLANQIGLLVRIARVPDRATQRDIVAVYHSAGARRAKAELRKQEDELGLPRPKPKANPEPETPSPAGEHDDAADCAATDNGTLVSTHKVEAEHGSVLKEIMDILGVTTEDECTPAIRKLRGLTETIHELRAVLADTQAKAKRLEDELTLFSATPLAELFRTLEATNVKDALRNARLWAEGHHAAE